MATFATGSSPLREALNRLHDQLVKMHEASESAREEDALKQALAMAEKEFAELKKTNRAANQQEIAVMGQSVGSWFGSLFLSPLFMMPLHLLHAGLRHRAERKARRTYEELRKPVPIRPSGGDGAATKGSSPNSFTPA